MTMGQAIAGVLALMVPAPWSVTDTAAVAAAVFTAAALLFMLVLVARSSAPAATPLLARAASVRDRAEQTVFLRLCDPDAAGRPRPRAPGR
ncbi:DUF6412 domain-containing protein [Kribbella sp. NPDC026596]|uniref:DUF6412 domain-containing protein n=1 Tax=Kribbella sp. NPDC026596 TaxID=3155122 RepID=UPI00340AF244